MAKEFVSSSSISNINTAKETTPVVSANCDAEEVTIHPKLHKDRDSPSKGRKNKEHLQQKNSATPAFSAASSSAEHHHQQQVLSVTSLDNDEKTNIDTQKHKDASNSSSNTTNLPQVIIIFKMVLLSHNCSHLRNKFILEMF